MSVQDAIHERIQGTLFVSLQTEHGGCLLGVFSVVLQI